MGIQRTTSSPDAPSADSQEIARLAEEEVLSNETQNALASLSTEVSTSSLKEAWENLIQKFNEIVESIFEKLGISSKSTGSAVGANSPSNEGTPESANPDVTREQVAAATEGSIERITGIYGLARRPSASRRNVYTSGTFGRFGSGDSQYALNTPQAESDFNALRQRGIKNVISLNRARSEINTHLPSGINHYSTSISNVATRSTIDSMSEDELKSAALSKYTNSFINSVKQVYRLYSAGDTLIHCQNGRHRSVCFYLICYMLENPNLTFEQAANATMSASERQDAYFRCYAPLAKVLDTNRNLRTQILNS